MRASIVGATGYAGGELIRILHSHPEVEIGELTSRSLAGRSVWKAHPNMRNLDMKFSEYNIDRISESDVVFLAVPHTASMVVVPELLESGVKVVDQSADFRLKSREAFESWYDVEHTAPELLERAVYGIPELYRDEMRKADLVACAGCEATTAILGLAPLNGKIENVVVDAKIGGCAAGAKANAGTHYPERTNTVRPYAPDKHRHQAEIHQEIGCGVSMSAHAVGMTRGILVTSHILGYTTSAASLFQEYKDFYKDSPFIRLTPSNPRYLPNPKYVIGSNYCDVGMVYDEENTRLVVFSAIDNMVKGAAGQAVQCMNLMFGFDETKGLGGLPIYPA